MELDDFKTTWDELGNQVKANQNLNLKIFDKMSRTRFHSNLKRILLPELLGSIICFGFAIFTIFNFDKLDTASFKIAGAIAILLFIFLPAISLWSIQQLYKLTDINKSYADTIKDFAVQKIKFCRLQKLNFTLSYLLLATVILISTRLFGRNDVTNNSYFFIISFGFGYIILLSFSKWAFKKYNKTIQQAEDLLNELAS
ncbi:MAG: hypothetical protein QM541_17235 [Flavobacterium sp.]|nr:hypothetical protein [Flavobacterium sp.]